MIYLLLIGCVGVYGCLFATGLLYQRVMNCTSCQYGLFTCQSATPPLDCGGETVKRPWIHTKKIVSDYINTSHFSFVLLSSLYSFSRSLFLSEHHLEADEGEEVVLDCFLPWHALVVGQTEYHYSWHPAEKNVHEHRQTNTFAVFKESRSHFEYCFRQHQKYNVVYFWKESLLRLKYTLKEYK